MRMSVLSSEAILQVSPCANVRIVLPNLFIHILNHSQVSPCANVRLVFPNLFIHILTYSPGQSLYECMRHCLGSL